MISADLPNKGFGSTDTNAVDSLPSIYRHFRVIAATATVAMTTLNGYHSNGYHGNMNEVVGW